MVQKSRWYFEFLNLLKKITYMEGRELYENQEAAKNLIWIGLSRGSLTEATKRLD